MKVGIIDYGSGNLHSAKKAFERAVVDAGSADLIELVTDPDALLTFDRIVLPGVGAFRDCRAGLERLPGMIEALEEGVVRRGRPFFGICVGMQLMATRGLEHLPTPGFGWIEGEVVPVAPTDRLLKVPHMGWNTITPTQEHEVLKGIPLGENGWHAYFVHSFHLDRKSTRLNSSHT